MRTADFTQNLLGMQTELHRFALKLTADQEEADDLLQETSLKALDNALTMLLSFNNAKSIRLRFLSSMHE